MTMTWTNTESQQAQVKIANHIKQKPFCLLSWHTNGFPVGKPPMWKQFFILIIGFSFCAPSAKHLHKSDTDAIQIISKKLRIDYKWIKWQMQGAKKYCFACKINIHFPGTVRTPPCNDTVSYCTQCTAHWAGYLYRGWLMMWIEWWWLTST